MRGSRSRCVRIMVYVQQTAITAHYVGNVHNNTTPHSTRGATCCVRKHNTRGATRQNLCFKVGRVGLLKNRFHPRKRHTAQQIKQQT
jgi:hypothetical protein